MLSFYNDFDNASWNALECDSFIPRYLLQLIFQLFMLPIVCIVPVNYLLHLPHAANLPWTPNIAANSRWPGGRSASFFPPPDLERECLGRVPCLGCGCHAVLACFIHPRFPNLSHCASIGFPFCGNINDANLPCSILLPLLGVKIESQWSHTNSQRPIAVNAVYARSIRLGDIEVEIHVPRLLRLCDHKWRDAACSRSRPSSLDLYGRALLAHSGAC